MRALFYVPSPAEIENRKRYKLCLWAYAYEIEGEPLVPDHMFDEAARSVNLSIVTKHQAWWEKEFSPATGMWIHSHPDLDGIARACQNQRIGRIPVQGVPQTLGSR